MESSFRHLGLLLVISISVFWTRCHGQTASTTAVITQLATHDKSTTNFTTTSGSDKTTSLKATGVPETGITYLSTSTADIMAAGTHTPSSMNVNETTTPATSTTYNSTLSSEFSTATTFSHEPNITIGPTSGNVSTSTDSFTTINATSPDVSSTTIPSGATTNTTSSNVSSETTTPKVPTYTPNTTFTNITTPETPYSPTPSSNSSSLATTVLPATTELSQSTGNSASTNQSDWSGTSKDSGSSAGVVLGAIIGSILGIALVCLVAYFMCGSRKTSEFSHRRLYEDIRNDPVLRLDNPTSYGDSSYYNPTAMEEKPYNGRHESIAMDNIRPH
ncbi:mucin-15 [Hyperolius riggenbachi]|uniref:mucin-15 n=1 Tax=Hyperolius riggenbachi TaxID=752182 RepID=UPI0035A2BE56